MADTPLHGLTAKHDVVAMIAHFKGRLAELAAKGRGELKIKRRYMLTNANLNTPRSTRYFAWTATTISVRLKIGM